MSKLRIKSIFISILLLLFSGRILSQVDSFNYTLFDSIQAMNRTLLQAAYEGNESDLVFAIKHGADVNCRTDEGITPLMYASQNGFTDLVKILVYNGANINLKPGNGIGALMAAVQYGHLEITDYLIEKGANLNQKDKIGRTALIYASAFNYADMSAILLNKGADPNIKSNDSLNALMIAAYSGYTDICKLLIEKGAQVNVFDNESFSPLMYAAENGYIETVRLLVEKGADINHSSDFNVTALMLATENGKMDVVKYLIGNGASTAMINKRSEDAYRISLLTGQKDISRLLAIKAKNQPFSPVFTKFYIGWGAAFNHKDCIFTGLAGLHDANYDAEIFAAFDTRYWGKQTQISKSDTLTYQVWERRYAMALVIQKNFPLKKSFDKESGLFAGVKVNYTFGNFKGLEEKIDGKFMLIPQLGVYSQNGNFGMRLNYEYSNYGTYDVMPHKISITFTGAFNLKKYYYLYKNISWL